MVTWPCHRCKLPFEGYDVPDGKPGTCQCDRPIKGPNSQSDRVPRKVRGMTEEKEGYCPACRKDHPMPVVIHSAGPDWLPHSECSPMECIFAATQAA